MVDFNYDMMGKPNYVNIGLPLLRIFNEKLLALQCEGNRKIMAYKIVFPNKMGSLQICQWKSTVGWVKNEINELSWLSNM